MDIPTNVPADFVASHPYYDQALGAIDGTHFRIEVAREDTVRFRNHKGFITTNVLIFCDWHMKVQFAYAGGEGSAHEATVLRWSKLLDLIPDDFYVLADAGYGLSDEVLTPYRGVRYHLKEWARQAAGRPQNAKELFNLRHAKARNVVERVIGVLKRRFKVLRSCMDFEMLMIKTVIFACIAAHNFIRDYDAGDLGEDFARNRHESRRDAAINARSEVIPFDFSSAENWRSWMADAMWAEYQASRHVNDDDLFGVDWEEDSIDGDSSSDSE